MSWFDGPNWLRGNLSDIPPLKRGLLPPSKRVELKFGAIFNTAVLAEPPAPMNRSRVVTVPWGMLLNNSKSDCVVAGACHETMQLTATGMHPVTFSDTWAAQDYWLMQGKPWWPFNDGGLDMIKAASYRRKTGIHDSNGIRHRVKAYLELPLGDARHLALAVWYLRVAGVGLNLPANAETMWATGQPWDDTSQPPSGEGHYVCAIDRLANGNFVVVTWGKLQQMSPAFYAKYAIVGIAYLSFEDLNPAGLTPEQWNEAKLNQFLAEL
jgi:hypothetical protein